MRPDDVRPDDMLDETVDESFPASDAPANTVETGIVTGAVAPADGEIVDYTAESRLELVSDGHTAFLAYERTREAFTIVHTEVPAELRGRHIGGRLVDAAVAAARTAGLRLVAVCPFARKYLHERDRRPQ